MQKLGIILLLLFVLVGHTFAQTPGIDPDEIDIAFNQPGMMVNMNFSPAQSDCEQAAASYLKPDMLVMTTEQRWFGNVGGGYVSDETLETYFATLFGNVQAHLLRSNPEAATGTALGQNVLATTTGHYTCLSYLNGTAMFWEVALYDNPAQTGWLIESVRWENLALNLGYQANAPEPLVLLQPQLAQPQNLYVFKPNTPPAPITPQNLQIQSLMTLESMEGYYLEPFAAVPGDAVPGELDLNLGLTTCTNSAPSFLFAGSEALYAGRAETVVEPPDFLLDDQIQWPAPTSLEDSLNDIMASARVNESADPVMPSPISMTWGEPLVNLTDNTQQICEIMREYYKAQHGVYPDYECDEQPTPPAVTTDGFVGGQIPLGTTIAIEEGPVCTTYTSPNLDQIFVWWQVSLQANGETLENVWLPESVSVYRKAVDLQPLPEPTLHHFYLMTPMSIIDALPDQIQASVDSPFYLSPRSHGFTPARTNEIAVTSPCEGLLAGRLEPGEQAYPFARLNMRDSAAGNVIGQVESTQTFTIMGRSVCLGGVRWVQAQSSNGEMVGWLAESDANYYYLVPGRAPQPVVTEPTPSDSGSNPNPPASSSENSAPQPLAQESAPVQPPTLEPTPTAVPSDPTGGSSQPPATCDPATGRGC